MRLDPRVERFCQKIKSDYQEKANNHRYYEVTKPSI